MSSRFVSGGAIDAETGEAVAPASVSPPKESAAQARKKEEWLAVQRELELERKQREEQRAAATQEPEKSLFEVLQANREAKQAAFEEANKFKNQFRALDDDEIEFLDGVKASQRAEEARVRRETEEGLAAFRQAQKKTDQDEAARAEGEASEEEDMLEDSWAAAGGRKRRRDNKERDKFRGIKRRASELKEEAEKAEKAPKAAPAASAASAASAKPVEAKAVPKPVPVEAPAAKAKAKAGLVDYGSSDDDDDDD